MKYAEIRQAFIEFFEKNKHQAVESSSLIPFNDPTLMFTNAGMNQFKDVFIGADKRSYNRAVTIQKCLRAGGKHNDLENVGFTARHHTFFEMMGNFSFGDYFKKDAISLAWEFLTEVLKIPKDRLYVTVFTTDDEAAEIWQKDIGVPAERIFRYGEKDNFWRMGQTGPCGPCSEIFYDHNPNGPKVAIDQDEDRFVEIWNLVFMQFFEDENGKQTPLPKPSVDTGAGIERLAAVMQGVSDNYQTDVFAPLIAKTGQLSSVNTDWQHLQQNPDQLGACKVVADHARAATFLIAEGVLPSNEGAGYVLRRIMRRAIRYGRKLNEKKSIYPEVCDQVISIMENHYPVLKEKRQFIISAVKDEERRFLQTLDKGSQILQEKIVELKKQQHSQVDGQTAFTLYDTYGFPLDLTEVIAREAQLGVDVKGFNQAMNKAKNLARSARKTHNLTSDDKHLAEWTQSFSATKFLGYEHLKTTAKIIGLSDGKTAVDQLTSNGWVIFDQTVFYAEGGGQVADHGSLYDSQKHNIAQVNDCKKINDVFVHFVELIEGQSLKVGASLDLMVLDKKRQETANNHSATHLLNAALKKVLGNHVNQAGSLVNENKLRFDFNHSKAITTEEWEKIETMVNEQIAGAHPVKAEVMSQDKAIAQGAVAMFGEKYGDEVRVLSMGLGPDGKVFSMELCGGTHVGHLAEIRLFKIMSESGVAAGVRRIEAITGRTAFKYLDQMSEEAKLVRKCLDMTIPSEPTEALCFQDALEKVKSLKAENQELKKDIKKMQSEGISIDELVNQGETTSVGGKPGLAVVSRVETEDRQILSDIADKIRDKKDNVAMVLIGESSGDKPKPLIVAVSKKQKKVHAGKITKELCSIMGGKGGGRPDFAQGSVINLDKLNVAKSKFYELIE